MSQAIVPIIGLEKLYVAKILKDDATGVTFDIPRYLPGIKEISVKPKVTSDEFYAENTIWSTDNTLASIDVEVNIADTTDEDEAFLLGHELAPGGGVIYNTDDVAPDLAILFKANKGNGKGRFVVLYKGQFSISDEDYKGKEGKSNFQAKKLKASFAPLHYNKMWKYKVDEDSSGAPADLETIFFASVIVPGSDSTAPTVTVVPADAATGVAAGSNIVFTFDKAIQADTVNNANIFLMKADGILVDAALSTSTDNKVVTLNPTSDLAAGAYVAICTKNVRSYTGIPLATNVVVNFTV